MKRTTTFLGCVAACSLCAASSFAQNGVTMPTMPSMPSMPTVGSDFYSPSTSGFYNGSRSQAQNKQADKTADGSTEANTGTKTASLGDAAKKALAEELGSALSSSAASGKDSASSALSKILTAKDIAALSDLGLVDDIGSALKKRSSAYGADGKDELEGLLSDWAKLKEETPKNQKKVSLSSTPSKSEAKILRFTADNADFLKTIKSSFFSTESLDGTFLLTGDFLHPLRTRRSGRRSDQVQGASDGEPGHGKPRLRAQKTRKGHGERRSRRVQDGEPRYSQAKRRIAQARHAPGDVGKNGKVEEWTI